MIQLLNSLQCIVLITVLSSSLAHAENPLTRTQTEEIALHSIQYGKCRFEGMLPRYPAIELEGIIHDLEKTLADDFDYYKEVQLKKAGEFLVMSKTDLQDVCWKAGAVMTRRIDEYQQIYCEAVGKDSCRITTP